MESSSSVSVDLDDNSHIRWHILNKNNNNNNKYGKHFSHNPPPHEDPALASISGTPYRLPGEFVCMSLLAIVWFWATVVTTFYCGTVYVLPILYGSSSSGGNQGGKHLIEGNSELFWRVEGGESRPTICYLLIVQEVIAWAMLVEVIINWACVRFIHSAFTPKDHVGYVNIIFLCICIR